MGAGWQAKPLIVDRNPLLNAPDPSSTRATARTENDIIMGGPPGGPVGPGNGGDGLTTEDRNILVTRGVFYATVATYDKATHTAAVDLADGTRITAACYASRAVTPGEKVACEYLLGSSVDVVITGARL